MSPTAALSEEVVRAVGDAGRLRTRPLDLAAYANDASHYLMTPSAVVLAHDHLEIARLLPAAGRAGTPVTFRSGGTSLSGQGVGSGILVDVRRGFRRIEVLDDGARVRVQPGATVRQVNARLARHGYRLGPDPASEIACTVGGVINNNSSGMACGIDENAYRTLESLVFVLPSGTIVDTADPDADRHLASAEPELVDGLERLTRRVRGRDDSVATIRRAFAMKNTIGYGVNAFLDFDRPAELLARLIVGSEGTLAFVAEATFRTVRLRAHAETALAIFPDLSAVTRAVPELVQTGATTLELMDALSLRVARESGSAPPMPRLPPSATALLIEYQADDPFHAAELASAGSAALAAQGLPTAVPFSADPVARAAAWKMRKGLYATVAGARPPGTTALLEDVVVPVPALAETCADLQAMFPRHGYVDGVIFGHAKDGNIHFMLTDRFETDEQLGRFQEFTEDLVDLVLAMGGNLKAEHGTGRAMAPYVRRQYGDELYAVMRELKRLCDPRGILNPGVIIDDDPDAHLRNIKTAEPIEAEADLCVECGYCESACPSRDLTLTPRQRIVVRRAMSRAEANGDESLVRELERDYDYDGVDTCAVDGMCQTTCPVLIDTGALMKRFRRERSRPVHDAVWNGAVGAWGAATRAGAAALTVAASAPAGVVSLLTETARRVVGEELVPRYDGALPRGGRPRSRLGTLIGSGDSEPVAVFLPACVNAMFGPEPDGLGVTESVARLAERAGVRLVIPDGVDALCCGTPWSSKGVGAGRTRMAERTGRALRLASDDGRLPVITDAASCTEGLLGIMSDSDSPIRVEDAVAFAERVLMPRLPGASAVVDRLALHPTCSSARLGLDPALRRVADAVAGVVTIPDDWSCCAYAGDRGLLHPELTASATARESAEVRALDADGHASCNRTCELGMTRAVGRPYRHVLELLEEATRPAEPPRPGER